MPAWIAALSPDTVLVAIAATGGVIALLLLISAVKRLRDWRIASGVVFLVLAAAVAALATAGAMPQRAAHSRG
jgi:multisubunit Na+/H+ antiporter MnhB subunit